MCCLDMSAAASVTASSVPVLLTLAPNARAPVRPTRSSARRISGWKMIGSAINRPVNELAIRVQHAQVEDARHHERRDERG